MYEYYASKRASHFYIVLLKPNHMECKSEGHESIGLNVAWIDSFWTWFVCTMWTGMFGIGVSNVQCLSLRCFNDCRSAVVLFWPKYLVGHPENNVLSLSIKKIIWIGVSKQIDLTTETEALQLRSVALVWSMVGLMKRTVWTSPDLRLTWFESLFKEPLLEYEVSLLRSKRSAMVTYCTTPDIFSSRNRSISRSNLCTSNNRKSCSISHYLICSCGI